MRMELDEASKQLFPVRNAHEDLSQIPRDQLELEVKNLRNELNEKDKMQLRAMQMYREVWSQYAGSREEEYHLQLNQTPPSREETQSDLKEILRIAGMRALGGGLPGAVAMGAQVTGLMWLRTTINYQYRYGTTTTEAMKSLYSQGGIPRFYRGFLPALFQGPLSRFGDTAANSGTLGVLDSYESTRDLPSGVKTLFSSTVASIWRIFLMPIDTCKTIMQVEGQNGFPMLTQKIKANGPFVLYYGALGASAATFIGHYPWFATHNFLQANIPQQDELVWKLVRNACIGFCSSAVSDTVSNSLRVIKTTRQTTQEKMSYSDAARGVIQKDGILGLFGRGLKTRIVANGLQGMLFTVIWKSLEDKFKVWFK